jgi:hypothetical protein
MTTTRKQLAEELEASRHVPRARVYRYQPETLAELAKVPRGTVNEASANLGALNHEPLLVCLDSLIRYAKAYRQRYDGDPLAEDGVLGPHFEDALFAIRRLLDGDGAVAMERGITTDSKDNGVCESLYWRARSIAGFQGER